MSSHTGPSNPEVRVVVIQTCVAGAAESLVPA